VEDLSALRSVDLGPTVGAIAGRIGYALRHRGTPAPATDLLIAAAALSEDCELWHQDAHFRSIAQVAPLRERSF
jgi:predicted nucleic acid-binding protein